jgi:DNA-binding Lrp family transcriptional regulator
MSEMTRLQKKFLGFLETDKNGDVYVDRHSIEEIPRRFRITKRDVNECIRELEKFGIMKRKKSA